MAELAKAVYQEGCFENYGVPYCMTVEAEELGAEVDMGSLVYEPHVIKYAIDSVAEYEKLADIQLKQKRSDVVFEAIRILKNETSDVLSFDSVVSLKEAGTHLPGKILMGNVSTYALEFGTPEKVKELTKVCMKNGSAILAPACGLGIKSPLKNVQAILETVIQEN